MKSATHEHWQYVFFFISFAMRRSTYSSELRFATRDAGEIFGRTGGRKPSYCCREDERARCGVKWTATVSGRGVFGVPIGDAELSSELYVWYERVISPVPTRCIDLYICCPAPTQCAIWRLVSEPVPTTIRILVPQRAHDQLRHIARRCHRKHRAWSKDPQPPHHQPRHTRRFRQLHLPSVQYRSRYNLCFCI